MYLEYEKFKQTPVMLFIWSMWSKMSPVTCVIITEVLIDLVVIDVCLPLYQSKFAYNYDV